MVRGALYSLLLMVLCLGAFSLPNADAQGLIDTAHFAIRPDSSMMPIWNIPNGAYFSFDHLLSIYESHGRFEYGSPVSPAFARSNSVGIDTIHLEGASRLLQDNSIRTTSTIDSLYADAPLNGGSLRPMILICGSSYATSGFRVFRRHRWFPARPMGSAWRDFVSYHRVLI